METASNFVSTLAAQNEALFQASEMQVEAYFKANPSKEAMVEHFRGRCMNEYRNMEEVASRLLRLSSTLPRGMVRNLAKQVLDEATHFDLVANVIEHLTGEEVNMQSLADERDAGQAKGVRCLEEFDENDLLALYTYQFIAEGRAHRVWQKMSEIIEDDYIARAYSRIAKDELFHSNIGRKGLEDLAQDAESQARVLELADQMRKQLYDVSCSNTVEVPAARAICVEAYGSNYLQ
ncbi:phenylacetic acid catabolism protein PaaA/PaaC family [Tahibacter aquaticus]|uniref:Phenylacetic acid catabolism protein PaaA/PaaC family n=1 Tax=Tahibacter aquaticus TaxID=520092 RepID=A0A4R6Z7E2_9GAMM|nr:ferritin-like domain-containing protein [Tahibacter aquaticus]TDR47499.1 phenylacetic acid catabolism protein PaaA/PaaC family [Tahibacter aquaticus]